MRLLHGRVRIVAAARSLERIAAEALRALDVAGEPRGSAHLLEERVIRLELLVSDSPVLDRDVVGQEVLAVALVGPAPQPEPFGLKAPSLSVPVHHGAADALARIE